jgi:thiol-disulfide isomerase/thioredoxin
MSKGARKQAESARGKAQSARGKAAAQQAREKVAAQRAAARRAQARRRALIVGGAITVVLAVVAALIAVKLARTPERAAPAATDAAVEQAIAGIPAATFNAVGAGTATSLKAISGEPELALDGKPEVLYMGGEYCPYCAAERWAVAAALDRFGVLSGTKFIHSSPTDVYPSTPTMSFYKSSYTSKYVAFVPVEWYSEKPDSATPTGYAYLQRPTTDQATLFNRYSGGGFPFVDIGNRYVVSGVQYLPSALANMTWAQVAAAMRHPSSPVARDIDGAANMITAAIRKLTHGQPAGVSRSAGVRAASASI